jgi:hypothetical protein
MVVRRWCGGGGDRSRGPYCPICTRWDVLESTVSPRMLIKVLDDASTSHRKLDAAKGQDAQLNDGARMHIVHNDLSRGGSVMVNIRKFTGVETSFILFMVAESATTIERTPGAPCSGCSPLTERCLFHGSTRDAGAAAPRLTCGPMAAPADALVSNSRVLARSRRRGSTQGPRQPSTWARMA